MHWNKLLDNQLLETKCGYKNTAGRNATRLLRDEMKTMTRCGDDETRGTTRQNGNVMTSNEMERDDATIKQTKRTWQDAREGAMQQ